MFMRAQLGFGLIVAGGILFILPLQSLLLDPFVTPQTFRSLMATLVAGPIIGAIGMILILKDDAKVERRQLDFG